MNTTALAAQPQDQLSAAVLAAITEQLADANEKATKLRSSALAINLDDDDAAMVEIANDELRDLVTMGKRLDERRMVFTRPIDAAKGYVKGLFDAPAAILGEGEAHLRLQLEGYLKRQREREAVARRETEALAAREREAAAQRQREAEEALAKAREAEDPVAEAVAEVAADQAEVAVELAEVYTPVVLPMAVPKGSGLRDRWIVGKIDLLELVQAAAEDPALLRYLLPNETRLGQYATMMKDEARVPGVTFEIDSKISVRRK